MRAITRLSLVWVCLRLHLFVLLAFEHSLTCFAGCLFVLGGESIAATFWTVVPGVVLVGLTFSFVCSVVRA